MGVLLLLSAAVNLHASSFDQTDSLAVNESDQDRISAHGYVKFIPSVTFRDRADSVFSEGFIHHRFNFKYDNRNGLTFRAEMRNRLYYGDMVRLQPEFGQVVDDDTGLIRLAVLWIDRPGFVLYSNFDRLLFQYDTEKFSTVVGRQRINWGMTTVWNPNDLFNAWNFLDFDYTERPGSDALRLRYFPSGSSSLEIAYSPGKTRDEDKGALAWRFNRQRFDYQVIAGKYNDDAVVGGGFAGHIGQTGFKGEGSYFKPLSHASGNESEPGWSIALEFDRTFKNEWYLNFSALHNKVSQDVNLSLAGAYRSRLSPRQLMPWEWNFFLNASKQITPPLSASMGLVFSPTEASTLLLPAVSWNVAENFDLDLVGQSFFKREYQDYKVVGNTLFLRMQLRY